MRDQERPDEPLDEEDDVQRGHAPGEPPVPTGIQVLLRMAAVDPEFEEELLRKRSDLAGPAGVTLTRSEAAMLQAVPESLLKGMVSHLPEPASDRREFLREAARAAVVLLGGAALAACGDKKSGKGGEEPPARAPDREMVKGGGAAPRVPRPRPPVVAPRQGDAQPTREGGQPATETPRPPCRDNPGNVEPRPIRRQRNLMKKAGGANPNYRRRRRQQSDPLQGL